MVLDYASFEEAVQDAKRIGLISSLSDITQLLRKDPEVILSLMKGKNMIIYDQIDNPWS